MHTNPNTETINKKDNRLLGYVHYFVKNNSLLFVKCKIRKHSCCMYVRTFFNPCNTQLNARSETMRKWHVGKAAFTQPVRVASHVHSCARGGGGAVVDSVED